MTMQISLPIWASATAFVLVSCSTGPKYAPDPSLTRTKANESYKAMDSEMAETAFSFSNLVISAL